MHEDRKRDDREGDHRGRDHRDHDHRDRDHWDHDPREITLISTDASGDQLNGGSFDPVASENGRYITFITFASDVLPSDPNTTIDLYLKDVRTGEVTLISANAQGIVGNDDSGVPALFDISNNGRYVAFSSDASNLVPNDSNGFSDVFVKDVRTGEVTLVSTDGQGQQGNGESQLASISDNGRYVAFMSTATNLAPDDTNGNADVFVKDLRTGRLELASSDAEGNEGDSFSSDFSISGNGRFVAFQSFASNLVPDDTNGRIDIFVKNLRTGEIARASTNSDGDQVEDDSFAPSISGNGRYVAFQSFASLVPDDTNGNADVYVKDLRTDEVTLVSTNPQGSAGNDWSGIPSISGNGRYVAFESVASDLVVGDDNGEIDIYVKDLRTDEMTLVSEALGGGSGNLNSAGPDVTNDGDVVFASRSSDLVAQDTNGLFDVFLWA
jgi:hypothetical protein